MLGRHGLLRESHDRYELDGPVPGLAIPATLHASLLARLDRLRTVKDVVQISAVGREFSDMAGGMGSRLLRPVQLATLAMAHAKTGEIEQCLRLSEEAFCTAEQSGEMQAAASLLRAYAEALFSRGRLDEAKHQFNRGLKIAEAQGAKFEERQLKARIASLFP